MSALDESHRYPSLLDVIDIPVSEVAKRRQDALKSGDWRQILTFVYKTNTGSYDSTPGSYAYNEILHNAEITNQIKQGTDNTTDDIISSDTTSRSNNNNNNNNNNIQTQEWNQSSNNNNNNKPRIPNYEKWHDWDNNPTAWQEWKHYRNTLRNEQAANKAAIGSNKRRGAVKGKNIDPLNVNIALKKENEEKIESLDNNNNKVILKYDLNNRHMLNLKRNNRIADDIYQESLQNHMRTVKANVAIGAQSEYWERKMRAYRFTLNRAQRSRESTKLLSEKKDTESEFNDSVNAYLERISSNANLDKYKGRVITGLRKIYRSDDQIKSNERDVYRVIFTHVVASKTSKMTKNIFCKQILKYGGLEHNMIAFVHERLFYSLARTPYIDFADFALVMSAAVGSSISLKSSICFDLFDFNADGYICIDDIFTSLHYGLDSAFPNDFRLISKALYQNLLSAQHDDDFELLMSEDDGGMPDFSKLLQTLFNREKMNKTNNMNNNQNNQNHIRMFKLDGELSESISTSSSSARNNNNHNIHNRKRNQQSSKIKRQPIHDISKNHTIDTSLSSSNNHQNNQNNNENNDENNKNTFEFNSETNNQINNNHHNHHNHNNHIQHSTYNKVSPTDLLLSNNNTNTTLDTLLSKEDFVATVGVVNPKEMDIVKLFLDCFIVPFVTMRKVSRHMNKLMERAKRRTSVLDAVRQPVPPPSRRVPIHPGGHKRVYINATSPIAEKGGLTALQNIRRASLACVAASRISKMKSTPDSLFYLPAKDVNEVLERMSQVNNMTLNQFEKLLKLAQDHKSRSLRSVALATLFVDTLRRGFHPVFLQSRMKKEDHVNFIPSSPMVQTFIGSSLSSAPAKQHHYPHPPTLSSLSSPSNSARSSIINNKRKKNNLSSIIGVPQQKIPASEAVEQAKKKMERERHERKEDHYCRTFIFRCLDKEQKKTISGSYASKQLRKCLLGTPEEQMEFTFHLLDLDNDGYLSSDDLCDAHEYTPSSLIKRDMLSLLDLCDRKIDVDLGARRRSLDYHNDQRLFRKIKTSKNKNKHETHLTLDEFQRVFSPPGYPPAVPNFIHFFQHYFGKPVKS